MFGSNWLTASPKYTLIHCPLCHIPMTFEQGKVPDNFYCASAEKIVKIQVKGTQTAVIEWQADASEREVEQGDQSRFLAKDNGDHISGDSRPVRVGRWLFEHLWNRQRSSP